MTKKAFAPYVVMYNDDTSWSLASLSAVKDATAVIFAFGNLTAIDSDITVDMGTSSFQKFYNKSQITVAIKALHAVGVKAILSINDNADGAGKTHWSDINTNEIADSFAKNVAKIVKDWGFDGVDLDNEDSSGTSYFGNIVPALRAALGDAAWISAPVYQGNEANLDLSTTAPHFNFVQTMNYDGDIEDYIVQLTENYPALNGKVLAGIGTPDATGNQNTSIRAISTLAIDVNVAGFSLWAVNYKDGGTYVTAIQNALNNPVT